MNATELLTRLAKEDKAIHTQLNRVWGTPAAGSLLKSLINSNTVGFVVSDILVQLLEHHKQAYGQTLFTMDKPLTDLSDAWVSNGSGRVL